MNFFRRLPLVYKIALPFILINLVTALIAGPVASFWVRERIETEMRARLEGSLNQLKNYLKGEENRLKMFARSTAARLMVQKAMREKNLIALHQALVPHEVINRFDFVEVTDSQGKVIYNHNGPFPIGEDLSRLEPVKTGLLGMNRSGFYRDNLMAVAPIYQTHGVAGLFLVGEKLRASKIKKDILGGKADFCIYLLGEKLRTVSTLKMEHEHSLKLARKVMEEEKTYQRKETFNGKLFYVVYSPLYFDNLPAGTIVLKIGGQSVKSAIRTLFFNVVFLNLFLVLTIAAFSYFLGHLIASPVKSLIKVLEEVGKGNYNVKARVKTGDEVETLAEAFNHMTEQIKKQQDMLNQKLFELSVIYDIALTISSTFNINEILPILSESARRVFDADLICVYLYEAESQNFKLGLCSKSSRLVREEEKVLEDKFLPELKLKNNLLERDYLKTAPFKSVMAQNMIAEGKTLGTIFAATLDKEYTVDDLQVLTTLAQQAAVAIENANLFDSLEKAYLGIVRALAIAIDARDPYTRGHSERVAKVATDLAKELKLSPTAIHEIEIAAYLHDIGKIGIPDDILLKPAHLNNSEMRRIREHPAIGASILAPLLFLGEVVPTIKHHHEHYDGGGYPDGLKGESIPLGARILTLADAFEAITSDRPYRRARTVEEAINEIKRCAGAQFDPRLVETFLRIIEKNLDKYGLNKLK